LKDAILEESYISDNKKYAEELLKVSNDMIIYDLINRDIMEKKGLVTHE